MRTSTCCAGLAMLFLGIPAFASGPKRTDARNDGFLGPIRSVSTREERSQLDWHQPDGPTVALPVPCRECEYDLDGNRIKTGQIIDGEFRGDFNRIIRDETRNATERIYENYKGEMFRRDVMGPYGIKELDSYDNGKQTSRATWSYDANGHVIEFYRYDQDGTVLESSFSKSDASGNIKEQWDYGRNGTFSLHFVDTYDPKTDIWTFTSFNENGSVKVAASTKGTKVLSYWQQPSEATIYGSGFYRDPENRIQVSHSCHQDGTCDDVITHFLDEENHLVSRVEWHDAAGVLKLSADYEYELDQFRNWTKRAVWVWNPELGERKLYETDYRALMYWNK